MIQVELVGFRDVLGRYARGHEVIREAQFMASVLIAEQAAEIYRQEAPEGPAPAKARSVWGGKHLKDSIHGEAVGGEGGAMVVIRGEPEQAEKRRMIAEGTPPHEIRPSNKLALWWAEAWHPGAVVHHPGTRANDWEERAATAAEALIVQEGARIADHIASRL